MALNLDESLEACRVLLSTLTVCTTGSTDLAATTTGYSRSSGSFITDGFRVGMEVTPTGFTDTTRRVISAVTATTMTVGSSLTAQNEASGRTLSVGQPQYRMYPNLDFNPNQASGYPYTEEAWLPGIQNVDTLGSLATVICEPIYLIKMWGLSGKGNAAQDAYTKKILSLFAPGTSITSDDGTVLRVKTRPGPFASQMSNPVPGRVLTTITVPLWAQITNDV